ncbi:ATP-binding cassette domain-containing protein [Streptomyces sp. Tue 6075]|uniref:ATP-binding cassette domain-containing protein n=1 Tax=Streptomyces sp. Tue 6075 TaxID=1661694 RepID=UPI00094AED0E|nr:ATP-binding cassette domain-containing protein [Streptomyces sp. Tue 6075]
MAVVEARELEQRRGTRKILHGVSFSVGTGVTGLLGPNGAGKTTLLETLTTLLPPSSGSLVVLGADAGERRTRQEIRRRTGFLPQNFGYPSNFRVIDFVEYAAWSKGVPRGRISELAHEAIRDVDLAEVEKRPLRALSGGMLRRAGIASAIVHRPPLLILDEPTVGLDPQQRTQFRELVLSLSARTSVLLSTHLTEDISVVCESVLVLNEGRIAFDGSVRRLSELGHGEAAQAAAHGDRVTQTALERGYDKVVTSV